MLNKGIRVLLAATLALGFAEAAQASRSEGAATGRNGVIRCGGNNFLRLGGTEVHTASYVLRNFDATTPIVIERIRVWNANGAVLFDSANSGLPAFENGVLGPGSNALQPNQTAQLNTEDVVAFQAQSERPLQMEVQWSAAKAALSLDAVTVRTSRRRDPATGQVFEERGRHAIDCRSIFLK